MFRFDGISVAIAAGNIPAASVFTGLKRKEGGGSRDRLLFHS
jgi:hypothetical protein